MFVEFEFRDSAEIKFHDALDFRHHGGILPMQERLATCSRILHEQPLGVQYRLADEMDLDMLTTTKAFRKF